MTKITFMGISCGTPYLRNTRRPGPPLPKRPKLEERSEADLENEVKFEHWESLPIEIRSRIAKETDILTRFSLMFTSKSNYDVARSVPIKIESIKVGDIVRAGHSEVAKFATGRYTHTISFKLMKNDSSEEIMTIYFTENKKGTMVQRFWEENKKVFAAEKMLLENANYREESVSFMDKLMALAGYQLDEVYIDVRSWGHDLTCLDKLRIRKKLGIVSTDGNNFKRWLNTAKSPLEELAIFVRPNESGSSQFDYNHDTIKNAKELIFKNQDESQKSFDISGLKCDKFDISDFETLPEVVNQFIKEWVNGNTRKNFFRGVFKNLNGSRGDLLVGVNYSRWLQKYRVKGKRLSEVFLEDDDFEGMTWYYIESKKGDDGAVLGYADNDAVFLVTGKQNRFG